MLARADVAQARWALGHLRDPRFRRQLRAAQQGLRLPRLPRARLVPGEVWGVTMVRNELDVIEASIRHLFEQGVDHVLVADNLSTDGTDRLLDELARRDPRVHVARDREPTYYQSEKITLLARAARRAGADWIVPFDADEFWFAEQCSVGELLRGLGRAATPVGLVTAELHHMVPTMAHPEPLEAATFLLDATPTVPGKVAVRSHRLVVVSVGNHGAARVGRKVPGLFIAHAIYRGPEQIARKARGGTQAVLPTDPGAEIAAHWRRTAALGEEQIEQAWQRISAGQPDRLVGFRATGPMVPAQPLQWPYWDPSSVLPPDRPPMPW